MCGTCGCKSAETLSKTSCCCGADESNPCACMKAPEPMECSAKAPKCACYKALEKNAEYDEEDMVYCNHCSDIVGNEKEVYGDETVEYKMANGELVCIPCYKIWMKEYKNDLDPHYSPFYAETFSAEEICKTYVCYTEMGGVGKDSDAKRGKKLLILMGATNIRIKNNPTKHEGQIISSDIPDDWMGMVRITFDYCTVKSKNTRSNVQNKIEWIADKRNPIHMNKRWAWNNNPKNDDDWIFADLDYLARTLEEKKDSHSAETFASDWWSMGRGNFQNSYDQAEAIEAIEECVRADGRGDMRLHEAMGAIQTIVNRTYGIGEPVGGENVRFEDFGAETFEADKDYEWEWDRIDIAPTELIKKRLKEAGFKLVDSAKSYGVISGYYEPKLVAKNGNLLDVTLSQNDEFDGFSRLTFYDDNDENTTGYFEIDWDILYEKGLLKGEDSVENPQLDYYQVDWEGLYDEWKDSHNCSDNSDLEIYEDGIIVMECNTCGRTATFEQKTPYEGPKDNLRKDAETFEAEYGPSVEGMIDNPASYYSYWQSFCEYLGVNDAHTAWRMVEKPWKWRTELEKWVNDSEWFMQQEAESFEAEELKPEVSVGDRVRSYDFILPDGTLIRDDCYMEGRVTKIAPVDWCGSECDHYYILVDRVVRNGEEIDSKTFTDFWNPTQLRAQGQMVFPSVSESYIEVLNTTFNAESEAETDEYKGPFEVEIRRPNGAVATWKRYDNYGKLIEALEEIVSKRYTPYAIDVFATNVPYISGFTAMGPVTDYRKFHLATWKYGYWESGPWAKHFPTGLE